MSSPSYHAVRLAAGFDLAGFDCGEPAYNHWLVQDAARAVESGSAAVHLLLETGQELHRVAGYYAICPTLVVREAVPKGLRRGLLRSAPGWLLAKLAVHRSLRGDPERQWGRQLFRQALLTIIAAADVGGGQLIVVDPGNAGIGDPGNAGLVAWYAGNGFLSTGAPDLRMYLKVATARRYLQPDRP